jgi:hypothetical protein
MLLNDMQTALNAGADRIGHGIVLGFPLPHGLAQLGFTAQPDGSWSRPTAGGGQPESYTPAQIVDPGITSGAPIDAAVVEARLDPYLERAIR